MRTSPPIPAYRFHSVLPTGCKKSAQVAIDCCHSSIRSTSDSNTCDLMRTVAESYAVNDDYNDSQSFSGTTSTTTLVAPYAMRTPHLLRKRRTEAPIVKALTGKEAKGKSFYQITHLRSANCTTLCVPRVILTGSVHLCTSICHYVDFVSSRLAFLD